jgi:hypothetical protein
VARTSVPSGTNGAIGTLGIHLRSMKVVARTEPMPHFYFDLLIDGRPHDQGGMILEDFSVVADRADALAAELKVIRPELASKDCFVRVVDDNSTEVYRTPLDPIPKSIKSLHR